MIYTLPKPYLSYSALNLWKINKDDFRNRYYLNIKFGENKYSLFGKEIHQQLEQGAEHLLHIPRYPKHEVEIRSEVGGVPILAYLDSFHPDEKRFLDYKTGMKKWTQKQVDDLLQLPFYSMLVEREYGFVHPETKIVWLETRLVKSTGLLTQGDTLELSGRHEVFTREISAAERDHMVAWVVESAKAISEDYQEFLNKKI